MRRGRKRGRKKQSFFSMSVQVVCGSLLQFYSTNKEETLPQKILLMVCSNEILYSHNLWVQFGTSSLQKVMVFLQLAESTLKFDSENWPQAGWR